MRPHYAPRGLIGVLTPQANTTVEGEFPLLLPDGVGMIAGRLTNPSPDMDTRLASYLDDLPGKLIQFGGAPLEAVAFACTGSSYLKGAAVEDAALAAAEKAGAPVFTSALALVHAFQALNAGRVALISPYHASLTAASVAYWEGRGLTVAAVETNFGTSRTGHPIYGLPADAVRPVVEKLKGAEADAIVILGTGYPSLETIAWAADIDGPPVVSSNLALAWRTVTAVEGRAPAADDLLEWIAARHWRRRL
jgi:maleate cis-trans isomerase